MKWKLFTFYIIMSINTKQWNLFFFFWRNILYYYYCLICLSVYLNMLLKGIVHLKMIKNIIYWPPCHSKYLWFFLFFLLWTILVTNDLHCIDKVSYSVCEWVNDVQIFIFGWTLNAKISEGLVLWLFEWILRHFYAMFQALLIAE